MMNTDDLECSYKFDTEERFALNNITFTDISYSYANNINIEKSLAVVKEFSSSWDNQSQVNTLRRSLSIRASGLCANNILNKDSDLELKNVSNSEGAIEKNKPCLSSQQTDISYWGLPPEIVNKYICKGIKHMFPWQVECLGNSRILNDNGNLVYSAPTSAGKTLVAEILTIKMVLEQQKKVIIILPFVSVVREKMLYFQDVFSESGIRVEGFMGSHTPPGGISSVHIAICTIEKANTLVNRLLEDGTISELGAVVVDELHLLGDPHRGYILELLLTKLLYITKRYAHIQIQIIGMSATLPNLSLLSSWLDADLYKTDFRPILLEEQYHIGGNIFDSKKKLVRTIDPCDEIVDDKDNIIHLCLETILDKCSVLIFCPTKNWCENLAQQISVGFKSLGYLNNLKGSLLREQLDGEAIKEVLEQLRCSPVGLDDILWRTISFGVAFHHAGLTMDERDIIEGAFKQHAIRVLVATSTLSSGVNFPARRVIIRSPTFRSKPIDISSYKQMVGRAGRMGIDLAGESILMCTANDKIVAEQLISGRLEPISSCLEGGDKLLRAVLEAIASQVANTPADVKLFIECTLLLSSLALDETTKEYADGTVKQLEDYELVRLQKIDEEMNYTATPLGKACLSSSMSPQDGLILFKELQKARECFVLETDLHMIYLVTPYSICTQWGEINWIHLLKLWDGLSVAMKRVGEMVGIQESLIYRGMRGSIKMNSPALQNKLQILRRFYTALALQDLVNEVPLSVVADNYNCSRGMLQSLQQSAATFAGMVTAFSRQLGWKSFEILVSQFQDRLQFGIQSDLIDLMRLQSLNGLRARALYNTGIESVCQLAAANVCIVENALHSAIPFQSEKEREGEMKYELDKRNKMKNVWITGKKGVTTREAAELLIADARLYLKLEMGVINMNWKSEDEMELIDKSMKSGSHQGGISDINLLENNGEFKTPIQNTACIKSLISGEYSLEVEPSTERHSTPNIKNSSVVIDCVPAIINDKVDTSYTAIQAENSFTLYYSSDDSLFLQSFEQNKKENNANDIEFTSTNNILDNSDKKKLCDNNDGATVKPVEDISNCSIFENDLSKSLSILFDDSLLVDTQLCDILDKKQKSGMSKLCTPEGSVELSIMSPDLGVYNSNLNLGEDVIMSSQESTTANLSPVTLKNGKPYSESNKRKINDIVLTENTHDNHSPLKIRKMNMTEQKEVIATIKECDILQKIPMIYYTSMNVPWATVDDTKKIFSKNEKKMYVINACSSRDTFEKCCFYAMTLNFLSLSLDIRFDKHAEKKKQIGSNLLVSNKSIGKGSNYNKQFMYEGKYLEGISLYTGLNWILYFNCQPQKFVDVHRTDIVDFLKALVCNIKRVFIIYDSKNCYIDLYKLLGINIECLMEDPKIADWLLDPGYDPKSFKDLAQTYCSINLTEAKRQLQKNKTDNSFDMKEHMATICLNAYVNWFIMESIKSIFVKKHCTLLQTFVTEMKIVKILAECELGGIGVDKIKAGEMLKLVKESQNILEKSAFMLTGRRFKFTSPSEVAKVLGMYKGRKISTNKKVLQKIDNPLAQIIVQWRKLNSILLKTLFPLTAKAVQHSNEKRLYGIFWTHTSTGRISMQDPNLQSVPRSFSVPYELLDLENINNQNNINFNCRSIFPAAEGTILISADYCQLELRLLTHLCEDPTLHRIVNSDVDIFKSIASTWKSISDEEVDDDLRQIAKQLCYGIIYGMGSKVLAQTLDICELEAIVFMKSFHSTYPRIKVFTKTVIDKCEQLGYVETLCGRRRYLDAINSSSNSEKSHAERQAVNTVIQGSAADILKLATISIHEKLKERYKALNHIKLVLLLHDELIYEVPVGQLVTFKNILKYCMESSVKLSVPLPVKIKIGKTWGDMTSSNS